MTGHDAAFEGLLDVSRRLRAHEMSPVELVEAQLERVDRVDPDLRSYSIATPELALEQARRAEAELGRGEVRGSLHGVPIAVKDVMDVSGVPTSGGMPMFRHRRASEDAFVVRRLNDAGAVLLGKLALTEGVYAEHHDRCAAPVNPWHPDYWCGASSSGSGVAVAAGLTYGALGSDTTASIRLPSAVNGATGIRPTWGRVSRHGVFELAATLDQVGPMARNVADAAALLGVIAGSDPADPTTALHPVPDYLAETRRDIRGLRIGLDPSYALDGVDEITTGALTATLRVLEGLGAEPRDISFPDPTGMVRDVFGVSAVQAARAHAETYPYRRDEYGPALAELLDRGRHLSGIEYQELLLRQAAFRGRVQAVFSDVDLILTPVLARTTPTAEQMTRMDEAMISHVYRFTCPFSMSGNPTITLPTGFTEQGLPIGMQLIARHFDESSLVRAGHAFQQATTWHRAHPDL